MEKRQKQVTNKDLFIGREKRKTMIPNDLITEILSRLPAKSLASKWILLSAPQPLNPDQNLSPLVVDHHKPFPRYFPYKICSLVRGLTCTNSKTPMICNPSTGQCIPLPEATPGRYAMRTFFAYDPTNKIFKVLYMYNGCRVLTLGTEKLSWRTIECSIPPIPLVRETGLCINGVLYYLSVSRGGGGGVVCFDVRLETFKFLVVDTEILFSTLINCKGRLGILRKRILENSKIELLVLDDADKQKWSKHIYVLSFLWDDITRRKSLSVVGMTCAGEIVLAPEYTQPDPFSIFYYNVERNTIVRVEIELGIVPYRRRQIYIFVDHVENVKLMPQPNA